MSLKPCSTVAELPHPRWQLQLALLRGWVFRNSVSGSRNPWNLHGLDS